MNLNWPANPCLWYFPSTQQMQWRVRIQLFKIAKPFFQYATEWMPEVTDWSRAERPERISRDAHSWDRRKYRMLLAVANRHVIPDFVIFRWPPETPMGGQMRRGFEISMHERTGWFWSLDWTNSEYNVVLASRLPDPMPMMGDLMAYERGETIRATDFLSASTHVWRGDRELSDLRREYADLGAISARQR